jgi:hypothetical protein
MFINDHNSTGLKINNISSQKTFKNSSQYHRLITALAEVKQISLTDLEQFLSEDHTSFSVLTAVLNQIKSANKTSKQKEKGKMKN